jgi:hypothetical protein
VLAGAALGVVFRSSLLALLVGFVFVVVSFVLFGYSLDHYSNNDCQPGEPCSTGEHVIRIVEPASFLFGSALVLVGLGRSVWDHWSGLRAVAPATRRVVRGNRPSCSLPTVRSYSMSEIERSRDLE